MKGMVALADTCMGYSATANPCTAVEDRVLKEPHLRNIIPVRVDINLNLEPLRTLDFGRHTGRVQTKYARRVGQPREFSATCPQRHIRSSDLPVPVPIGPHDRAKWTAMAAV